MLILKYFLSFQLTVLAQIRVEFYHTSESDSVIPHDCLNEHSFQWQIKSDNQTSKWNFNELREKKITSEQLYYWSASIDIIEEYQSVLSDSSSSFYWNCTWPQFGLQCQYEFYRTIHQPASLKK